MNDVRVEEDSAPAEETNVENPVEETVVEKVENVEETPKTEEKPVEAEKPAEEAPVEA